MPMTRRGFTLGASLAASIAAKSSTGGSLGLGAGAGTAALSLLPGASASCFDSSCSLIIA